MNNVLPYWGEVAKWFISYALITSVIQGKIDFYQAKQENKKACKAIELIYVDYIDACEKCYFNELHNLEELELLKKLKTTILQPIKDNYHAIGMLINNIEYDDYTGLNEQVRGNLDMFYNIAYSFGIINITSILRERIQTYSPLAYPKKWTNLFTPLVRHIELTQSIVNFAGFIERHDIGAV